MIHHIINFHLFPPFFPSSLFLPAPPPPPHHHPPPYIPHSPSITSPDSDNPRHPPSIAHIPQPTPQSPSRPRGPTSTPVWEGDPPLTLPCFLETVWEKESIPNDSVFRPCRLLSTSSSAASRLPHVGVFYLKHSRRTCARPRPSSKQPKHLRRRRT